MRIKYRTTRERSSVKLVKMRVNHIVGLVHKTPYYKWRYRIRTPKRTCLMYHAACKVEFQPFNRSYSQLTFFNFLYSYNIARVCSVRYRYSRYRYGCRTELTEVSGTGMKVWTGTGGTGIHIVPNLPKCPVPVIPAVYEYTGGMPRYIPYRTHRWNIALLGMVFLVLLAVSRTARCDPFLHVNALLGETKQQARTRFWHNKPKMSVVGLILTRQGLFIRRILVSVWRVPWRLSVKGQKCRQATSLQQTW